MTCLGFSSRTKFSPAIFDLAHTLSRGGVASNSLRSPPWSANTSSQVNCTMEAPTDQAAAARLRAPMAFTR